TLRRPHRDADRFRAIVAHDHDLAGREIKISEKQQRDSEQNRRNRQHQTHTPPRETTPAATYMCSAFLSASSTASCIISLNVGCGKIVCARSSSVSSPARATV